MKVFSKWLLGAVAAVAAVAVMVGCSPSKSDVAVVPQIVVGDLAVPINPSTGPNIVAAIASQTNSFVFTQGITASSVTAPDGRALPLQLSTGVSTWSFAKPAGSSPTLSALFKKRDGSVALVKGNLSFGSCIWTITSDEGSVLFEAWGDSGIGSRIVIEDCQVTVGVNGFTANNTSGVASINFRMNGKAATLVTSDPTVTITPNGDVLIDGASFGRVTLSNPTGGGS